MFYQFTHPFTLILSGPSGSGKSTFLVKMLKNLKHLVNPSIKRVTWCYSEHNSIPKLTNVDFYKGIPDTFENPENEEILLILDDLMMDAYNNKICELFTKGSHHRNLSVILVTQNIFHQGARTRDISLNTKYFIVFKNPRDKMQFQNLARQIYPENFKELQRIYKETTEEPHGYLLIDLTQDIHDFLRFRTDIFNKEFTTCFCAINENDNGIERKTINRQQAYVICPQKSKTCTS
jgi:GTPase SAR1 family protein